MRKLLWIPLVLTPFVAPAKHAQGAQVVVDVFSPSNGSTLPAGTIIQWSITASVSSGDNLGLALISLDLVQSGSNPAMFDLTPAESVPSGMEGFSRPAGISNPGPGGVGSGYGGTAIGMPGQQNLVQIGGAQNTFGVSGGTIGVDVNVEGGIGHPPGGQLLAEGSFVAPPMPGTYTLSLTNVRANTLVTVAAPPTASQVAAATAAIGAGSISFTLCRAADTNEDTIVTAADIPSFVDILLSNDAGTPASRCAADVNGDGTVDGNDVQPFVATIVM